MCHLVLANLGQLTHAGVASIPSRLPLLNNVERQRDIHGITNPTDQRVLLSIVHRVMYVVYITLRQSTPIPQRRRLCTVNRNDFLCLQTVSYEVTPNY